MNVYKCPGSHGSQTRMLNPLKLELQMAVNKHMDPGNQTWSPARGAKALKC